MLAYIIAICTSDAIILFLNLLLCQSQLSVKGILIVTLLLPPILIAIDGVAAGLVRYALPKKWFDYKVKFHIASKKECRFYEKIGIKSWKDHVVELGMFTAFSKKEVAKPNSIEYIERFILECNYGVLGHLAGVVCGYLLLFCFPQKYMLTIVLPAACVNAVLSILPLMVLRYNVPRLQSILSGLQKHSAAKD
ncbi:MAG: hypothetical protein J6Y60_14680 [Treponema sp.]|nr:hypothetical protein [Treponema sp.]